MIVCSSTPFRDWARSELHALGHGALHVALVFTISNRVAFVVLRFALRDPELDFGVRSGEVELEGDEGDAFDIDGSREFFDLSFFGEQDAVAFGSVVECAGGLVWGDVDLVEGESWGIEIDGDEALFERAAAVADAFDFGSFQNDPDLDRVLDEVVVAGTAVVVHRGVGLGFLFLLGHCCGKDREVWWVDHLLLSSMSMMGRVILCVSMLIVLMGAGGCTREVNARLELGAKHQTPTFAGSADSDVLDRVPMERARWDTTVVIAPVDGVVHGAVMRRVPFPRKSFSPRRYGLVPTSETALEFQREDGIGASLGMAFGVCDEIGSSLTCIFDPFEMHYELSNTLWSPMQVWKRASQEDNWSSGLPIQHTQDADNE